MSRILRTGRDVRRSLARGASPHGTGEPRASQPEGQESHLARQRWPRRTDPPGHGSERERSGRPHQARSHDRELPAAHDNHARLLPHAIQLCIHCRQTRPDSRSAAPATRQCAAPGACPAARTWTLAAITSSRSIARTTREQARGSRRRAESSSIGAI